MAEKRSLGRLETVPLRDYWHREDTDFTPWLANEDNIRLLGSILGLELVVDETEVNIGSFRADIVCTDERNSIVLIENQLQTTNHSHLGQALTYAAGLEAVTIVWIASRFTEEHRAAVDWLNSISHDQFNFFALEIELLRIGESDPAPRFNVIAKPNNWSRMITDHSKARTELQQLTFDYWASFGQYITAANSAFNPPKPSENLYAVFGIGKTGFNTSVSVSMRDKFIGVDLVLTANNANELFDTLISQKDTIQNELAFEMDWQPKPEAKQCSIQVRLSIDSTDSNNWPEMHRWNLDHLTSVDRVFRPRIASLV